MGQGSLLPGSIKVYCSSLNPDKGWFLGISYHILYFSYLISNRYHMFLKFFSIKAYVITFLLCAMFVSQVSKAQTFTIPQGEGSQRILLDRGWKFFRYKSITDADSLIYDVRPEVHDLNDSKPADSRPTEAVEVKNNKQLVLKPWILPTGNKFIKDSSRHFKRPSGNPGSDFPFVQANYNDATWEDIILPHDWAVKGPFYTESNPIVGGSMARLPIQGVAWYRNKLMIPASDAGKSFFLDVDGAMSYSMVWLNGNLVGGWPYGYNSWRVDLTPYIRPGKVNQLAIRLDNPASSSRWYPGSGLYRNVWLVKNNSVHVGQYGTYISTRNVSSSSATIDLKITIDNDAEVAKNVEFITRIFSLDSKGQRGRNPVVSIPVQKGSIKGKASKIFSSMVTLSNPKLWGPLPTQVPNLYVASTQILANGKVLDTYESQFGIRTIQYDAIRGIVVNGEPIVVKGANHHHDLGPLGTAYNNRAAERQLEILRESGCNAIRMSHNPPAPEFLELCDKMGFLVMDEIYDMWKLKKSPLDFHLIFSDWHEQDVRSFVRRDRNHPSVIIWSFGNEVGEQYTGQEGADLAAKLNSIVKEEDPLRATTLSMNYAKPNMPFAAVADIISLNYQGEGIRYGGVYSELKGINTPPLFPAFRNKFPDKMILSSENASAFSSRGEFIFPVFEGNSSPIRDGIGGNSKTRQVSAYELYSADFGSSADKVFATMDQHPFVAGGFVWTGWDYLGEPTPYYMSRSSYSGIIDLAGFKKERFYLYQSYWKPETPMAHILPHWNWSDRLNQVTPVHVFTSGDEAELFLNGISLGRKKKGKYEYRLRWDDVRYTPGTLKVITYKNGKKWAEDEVKTTGEASRLNLSADRTTINSDGKDLAFITVRVTDKDGNTVPNAKFPLRFSIEGNGEIVATDNGDAANMTSFSSASREAFNGLCLVIIRAKNNHAGKITLKADGDGLVSSNITLTASSNKVNR